MLRTIQPDILRSWLLEEARKDERAEQEIDKEEAGPIDVDRLPPLQLCFEVVDVRSSDFQGGHLPGATNIPWDDPRCVHKLSDQIHQCAGHKSVVVHCMFSESRAPAVVRSLLEGEPNLCTHVSVLSGGFAGWMNDAMQKQNRRSFAKLVADFDPQHWTYNGDWVWISVQRTKAIKRPQRDGSSEQPLQKNAKNRVNDSMPASSHCP